MAFRQGFWRVFLGRFDIGGWFSAFSEFGMALAVIIGIDLRSFMSRTRAMVEVCGAGAFALANLGAMLGMAFVALAEAGCDKVIIIASPCLATFGAWLEQLLAESTGKQGRGLIPVDGEPLGGVDDYGSDRMFVYLRFSLVPSSEQDRIIAALEEAGQFVVRMEIEDFYDLGQELFRWEFATAVAASHMELNLFDQPDVEASKAETRRIMTGYERGASPIPDAPFFSDSDLQLFADEANRRALDRAVGRNPGLTKYLRAHLRRIRPGDYFAVLAYIERNLAHSSALENIRRTVRDHTLAATCAGFGPRFLHSTGQAYKGGPNTGVFLQVTAANAVDVPAPGRAYTLGAVKDAQAYGDFAVLSARGRRALRVHLGPDVPGGLSALHTAILHALAS